MKKSKVIEAIAEGEAEKAQVKKINKVWEREAEEILKAAGSNNSLFRTGFHIGYQKGKANETVKTGLTLKDIIERFKYEEIMPHRLTRKLSNVIIYCTGEYFYADRELDNAYPFNHDDLLADDWEYEMTETKWVSK